MVKNDHFYNLNNLYKVFHEVKAIWSWLIDNNLFPFKLEIIGINENTKFDLVIWYPMHNCVNLLHPMHIYPNVRFVISYWMSQSSNLQMCDQGCPTRFKRKWFAKKKKKSMYGKSQRTPNRVRERVRIEGEGLAHRCPSACPHILQYLRTNLDYLHVFKPHRGYPIPYILII